MFNKITAFIKWKANSEKLKICFPYILPVFSPGQLRTNKLTTLSDPNNVMPVYLERSEGIAQVTVSPFSEFLPMKDIM